jgi:hypothetical protein
MTAGQFDDIGDPAEKPGINTVNALRLQTSPWVPGAQRLLREVTNRNATAPSGGNVTAVAVGPFNSSHDHPPRPASRIWYHHRRAPDDPLDNTMPVRALAPEPLAIKRAGPRTGPGMVV